MSMSSTKWGHQGTCVTVPSFTQYYTFPLRYHSYPTSQPLNWIELFPPVILGMGRDLDVSSRALSASGYAIV